MAIERELLRYALWSTWASGLPRLMARRHAGRGGILSFHRVLPRGSQTFASQAVPVTPETFRGIVRTLKDQGYSFLSMSGLADWLQRPEDIGKFVCLTFDDGFTDTYTQAFPVCQEFGVPMTVYLVPSFVRREFPLWLLGLEAVLATTDIISLTVDGREFQFAARTERQKRFAYQSVAPLLVAARPEQVRAVCHELEHRYGIDFAALAARDLLTPAMITNMQASGLVEFGAHGVHHACLGRLDEAEAYREIAQSKQECEALLGVPVHHFAYPYGDSEAAGPREAEMCRRLGFRTAVTTECNTIFTSDRLRPFLLPRLTYNGNFQDAPLLELLLSGTLPRLRRALRAGGATGKAQSANEAWSTRAEQA